MSTTEEHKGELQTASAQAMARAEIESALTIAAKFPRDEAEAESRVMRACSKIRFAGLVQYTFTRGKGAKKVVIKGGTVKLARELARCWGNIRWGADAISDTEESRTLRCWAWDMETNARVSRDTTFSKLVKRATGWVKPDERDLRELAERMAAFGVRNCLFDVLPEELVQLALETSQKSLAGQATKDPAEARRQITEAFRSIGVSVKDLEQYLGHPVDKSSPTEIAELRPIWKAISDGQAKWVDYLPDGEESGEDTDSTGKPKGKMGDLTGATAKPEPSREEKEARGRSHGMVCRDVLLSLEERGSSTAAELAEDLSEPVHKIELAVVDLVQAGSVEADEDLFFVAEDGDGAAEPEPGEKPKSTVKRRTGDLSEVTDPLEKAEAEHDLAEVNQDVLPGPVTIKALEDLQEAKLLKDARAIRKEALKQDIPDEDKALIRDGFREAEARIKGTKGEPSL
jgi:hypothetical protein